MSISGLYSTLHAILTTPLTTSTTTVAIGISHADPSTYNMSTAQFQHEALICALAVSFCRYTVPCTKNEPHWCRLLSGAVLGCMALSSTGSGYGYSYTTICIVQLWSYLAVAMVEYGLAPCRRWLQLGTTSDDKRKAVVPAIKFGTKSLDSTDLLLLPPLFLLSALLSHLVCTSFAGGSAQHILRALTPKPMLDLCDHLFPISELYRSYDLVAAFVDPAILNARIYYLLFVTFNVQVGMGYLGIGFLREEQMRRNQLVRMEIIEKDAEEEDQDRAVANKKKVKVDEDDDEAEEDGEQEPLMAGRTRSSARRRTAATPNGRSKSRSRSKSRTRRSASASAKSSKPVPTTTTSSATDEIRTKQLRAATTFRRSAAPFIFFAVLPYMFQIIFYGNMNMYAFHCVRDDVHRQVRIHGVFGHDAHLVAMAENSAMGPGFYGVSMDTVVSTTYDIFNRKLFSLPKLMLLPGVVMRQPMLLVQIFPFVFVTDFIKARLVAFVTTTVENLEKEAKDVKAIRQKVEAFDVKNAELLQRSGFGATEFTRKRWEELTIQYQDKKIASELLKRSRTFFQWLQRNFIFVALIDCALAQLIAVGRIVSAEIFVFSRAIEDTVDLLLMRSRAESELATMMTEIDKLQALADVWENSQERSLLPCVVDEASGASKGVVLENVMYSRGTALVRVEHMEIPPGIYAVTGANGSGKSTLFRVLMSCQSNDKPIDLPTSIVMETPKADFIDSDLSDDTCTVHDGCDASGEEEVPIMKIAMPSADVAEISQNFYWPLYTKPIDWIYQEHLTDCDKEEREKRLNRVTEELMGLAFSQIAEDPNAVAAASTNKTAAALDKAAARAKLFSDLQEEKEDWFEDLSGGQKSKVELVRKVFLHDACPKVLLIDETMAPLDPASKSLVMGKLKAFCRDSVVLVIYHTDVGRSVSGGDGEEQVEIECVPSNNFFHHNLHVENRMLTRRSVC